MTVMRRREKEIPTIGETEAVIRCAPVCRPGLCDKGFLYGVPVCFGFEPGSLWIHSAREGKKIGFFNDESPVCFEIDEVAGVEKAGDPCARRMRYTSVIGSVRAEFVRDPVEMAHVPPAS